MTLKATLPGNTVTLALHLRVVGRRSGPSPLGLPQEAAGRRAWVGGFRILGVGGCVISVVVLFCDRLYGCFFKIVAVIVVYHDHR